MDNASENKTEEDEKRALLEKIKDASNGPEHAKRRIEALDKMVYNLKSRRRFCGESMAKDKNQIAWIDKEIEQIMSKYRPLLEHLKSRIETRDSVEQNLKLAEKTMLQIMGQTKGTAITGMLSNSKMQKREASVHLKASRGFGATPDTTFRQNRRNKK